MRRPRLILSALLGVMPALLAHGQTSYTASSLAWCGTRATGWHFYCDPTQEEEPKLEKKTEKETEIQARPPETPESSSPPPEPAPPAVPPVATAPQSLPHTQMLEQLHAQLEESRARAVLDPSPANLRDYLTRQIYVLETAQRFADAWQVFVWQNPAFDYTHKRPVESLGALAYHQEKQQNLDRQLLALRDRYGLFFVFGNFCQICHVYAPVLREWSNKYQLDVLAIAVDEGPGLVDFPEALFDQGQLQKIGVQGGPIPQTYLYDNETESLTLMGIGFMSQQTLSERIVRLTSGSRP